MIKSLDRGKPVLIVKCICGNEYESRYNRGTVKRFLKEFGEYENHLAEPCPACGRGTAINLNVPETELTEEFFEAVGMPEAERQERRALKLFMGELTFEEQ